MVYYCIFQHWFCYDSDKYINQLYAFQFLNTQFLGLIDSNLNKLQDTLTSQAVVYNLRVFLLGSIVTSYNLYLAHQRFVRCNLKQILHEEFYILIIPKSHGMTFDIISSQTFRFHTYTHTHKCLLLKLIIFYVFLFLFYVKNITTPLLTIMF